jgi:hypothetical protein
MPPPPLDDSQDEPSPPPQEDSDSDQSDREFKISLRRPYVLERGYNSLSEIMPSLPRYSYVKYFEWVFEGNHDECSVRFEVKNIPVHYVGLSPDIDTTVYMPWDWESGVLDVATFKIYSQCRTVLQSLNVLFVPYPRGKIPRHTYQPVDPNNPDYPLSNPQKRHYR